MRRIYVASSWRNTSQGYVVQRLVDEGHTVYDFKRPAPDEHGFHWSEIDPNYRNWTTEQFKRALGRPLAEHGFANDFEAMRWADTGVLLLPCGRSAHLEAGWLAGQGKEVFVLVNPLEEPELMYKLADGIFASLPELILRLREPPIARLSLDRAAVEV